jgi:hypothetical protein
MLDDGYSDVPPGKIAAIVWFSRLKLSDAALEGPSSTTRSSRSTRLPAARPT